MDFKGKNIVAVFAHPDDEIAAAGVLIRAKNMGMNTYIICATRGEGAQIRRPDLVNSNNQAEIRTEELQKSCEILGINKTYFLELKDGYSCIWDIEGAVDKLSVILKKINPDTVITFDSNGGNGHPNHIDIYKITTLAFQKNGNNKKLYHLTKYPYNFMQKYLEILNYTESLKTKLLKIFTIPDEQINSIIKLTEEEHLTKVKAMECHKSQFPDENNNYYGVPYNVFKELSAYECYYLNEICSTGNKDS